MATVKTFFIATSCSLMLLGAVSAHAKLASNGVNPNGVNPNGVSPNGVSPNGVSPNGVSPNGVSPNGVNPNGVNPNGVSPNGVSPNGATIYEHIDYTPGTPLNPGFPFNSLSHRGLGKPAVDPRTP